MLPTLTGLCGDAAVGEGKEADGFGSAVPELGVCSAETSFLILERFPDRLCLLPPFFGLELSCPLLEVCCLQHAQQGKPARHQFSLCWRTCRPARVPSAFMRLAAAAAQLSPLASWMLPPGVGKVSPCRPSPSSMASGIIRLPILWNFVGPCPRYGPRSRSGVPRASRRPSASAVHQFFRFRY